MQSFSVFSQAAALARAIFDNVAEESRELAFHKDDLLHVVSQNPNGLNGWWLCQLKGQEGLAPANRLQLLKMDTVSFLFCQTSLCLR